MAVTFESALLETLEKDDIKAFDTLMEETQCGAYRLGRFPVLSLLYLYSSRAILAAYEQKFLKFSSWNELGEPAGAAKLFAEKAGKCLRLYLSEVVSPLEMLLILDKPKKLKKIYPFTNPSKTVKSRLQAIYSVKYSLGVRFEGSEIILDRRPLNGREKKKIITLCVSGALAAAIAVATPTTLLAVYGKRSGGDVTRLSHIDFNAKTTYTLKKDLTIPENYRVGKTNCTIIGNGHKLVIGKNASLGELSGKLSGLEITTSGSPVFTQCTQDSQLFNVTVNVACDIVTAESSAFIADVNNGTFDGVTLNVGGKISAVAGDEDELIFGGMARVNYYYGTIKNCGVNYDDFSIAGETAANATFGGITAVNYGIVQNCSVAGKIKADTFDLAGACYVNYSRLSGIVNSADLSQTSDDDGWSPIVGGIAVDNASVIEYCQNVGNLAVTGSDFAICGGIAARSYGQSSYCLASCDVSVTAQTAYVGGIFGMSQVASNGRYIYFGVAAYCISEVNITASLGEGISCVGGICGLVQQAAFTQYKTDENGSYVKDKDGKLVTETIYLGGGVKDSFFLGGISGNADYRGSIVGVCGAEIYEANSYTDDEKERHNFENNYYLESSLPPFGATASADEQFKKVEGKGCTPSDRGDINDNQTFNEILEKLGKAQ